MILANLGIYDSSNFDSLGVLQALIVTMAQAPTAAVSPGIHASRAHQDYAMLKTTRDDVGLLLHEQGQDFIWNEVTHQKLIVGDGRAVILILTEHDVGGGQEPGAIELKVGGYKLSLENFFLTEDFHKVDAFF